MSVVLTTKMDGDTIMVQNERSNQQGTQWLLVERIMSLCQGRITDEQAQQVAARAVHDLYDGIPDNEVSQALMLAAASCIEDDPIFDTVASRLVIADLATKVITITRSDANYERQYRQQLVSSIEAGCRGGLYDKRMLRFDLQALANHLNLERDDLLCYLGLQTLSSRYFSKLDKQLIELPQIFWMRVAMGMALEEQDCTARAAEFYDAMSSLRYVPSTPTLLHAGLVRAQLSSCFLGTTADDLKNIFKVYGDIAELSKWSGGVAYDWTPLRSTGALIKTINVESQGLIPFLKIANDVTAAINRSGRRRSATVAYLEVWHFDFEDFCDMRKNTGDERRRAHDINFAAWIPDLFVKRVLADGDWTFFSPDETPDLHDLYGAAFEQRYCYYEQQAREGKMQLSKTIKATDLWRRMLTRLFETGFPWLTFKDACNIRSPQDHVGVVHSSNLCTEITLNTSTTETAVCNLGSVNISKHMTETGIDYLALQQTIRTGMRMLDNVIDLNFYPTIEAKTANERHRPTGFGMMGWQDVLFSLHIPHDDPRAAALADELSEHISYYAIEASSQLAAERGSYSTFKGSKWDRGIMPHDTIALLERERGESIHVDRTTRLDWQSLRGHIAKHGMRNSNTQAVAPTATIANIAGCYPSIEPQYSNIYVKSNMAGEFTVVNKYLIADLKRAGLWNKRMKDLIKFHDGSIQAICEIPAEIRDLYKGAFELDPEKMIQLTAIRGKWVDQSISHNVFMKGVSGKKLHDIYISAWRQGLKCTYYLRTLGASQIEKSTLDAKEFGYTQQRPVDVPIVAAVKDTAARSCGLDSQDCESCQ